MPLSKLLDFQHTPRLQRLIDFVYSESHSNVGLGLLALALLINLVALIAVDRATDHLGEKRTRIVTSRVAIGEIQGIQSMLYEAESAQRGYLYTGKVDYLLPLRENEIRIPPARARMRAMVNDEPLQLLSIDRISALATEKIAELNETVALHQSGQKEAARSIVLSDHGKNLIAEIDTEIARFLVRETAVLSQRSQDWSEIQLAIRWGFAAIIFMNAMMIMAGAIFILRNLARERAGVARHDLREVKFASEAVVRAEELRALSAHLLTVQEEERYKVARDLHDELGGTLSAIKLDIIMGRDAAAKRNDEKSVARLQRAHTAIDSAVQFVRRLIEDLRPTLLDNLGFEAALRSLTGQFSERADCRCKISLPPGELDLSPVQSTALYRVCQEALTNVMKYAKAQQVTIALTRDATSWTLIIADDGVGLAIPRLGSTSAHGLLGMRERMIALGGSFEFHGADNRGTTLTAKFPMVRTSR